MNHKESFGNIFRSKLRCFKLSAARDCSTCQFRVASLSELEFHKKSGTRKDLQKLGDQLFVHRFRVIRSVSHDFTIIE